MRLANKVRLVPIALLVGVACSSEPEERRGVTGDSRGVRTDPLTLAPTIPFLDFEQNADDADAIALTFDDGPDSVNTPKVLDVLKSTGVKATFYINSDNYLDVNASSVARNLVERMHNEGHHIGNHTAHHYDLGSTSTNVNSELNGVYTALKGIVPGSLQRRLVRAPFGSPYFGPQSRLDVVAPIVARYGVHTGWNIDPVDYGCGTASCVTNNVLRDVDAGKNGLVLLHSTQASTAAALPSLISSLRSRALRFVFVEELVIEKYGKPSRQLITCSSNSDCVTGEICGSNSRCAPTSGGSDAGVDTGVTDTGVTDSTVTDTAVADTTVADTTVADSSPTDSGTTDAGTGVATEVFCQSFVVVNPTVSNGTSACGSKGVLAKQNNSYVWWRASSGTTKASAYAQYQLTGIPKQLSVNVSFLGDDASEPLWYWSILNPATGGWVTIGDNSWAGNWVRTARVLPVADPAQYVDASGHVKVRFRTETSSNDGELDRMTLTVTY